MVFYCLQLWRLFRGWFSATSDSPCSSEVASKTTSNTKGCETGRRFAGVINLPCLSHRVPLTLYTVHGLDKNFEFCRPNWLEMPAISPICFMQFNEQPRLQLAAGTRHSIGGRCCPTQRHPWSADSRWHVDRGWWWGVVESIKRHPPCLSYVANAF